jgi:hypothetical protein
VPKMVSSVQLSAATGEVNPWVKLNYWKAERGGDSALTYFPGLQRKFGFRYSGLSLFVSALQSKLTFVLSSVHCIVLLSRGTVTMQS